MSRKSFNEFLAGTNWDLGIPGPSCGYDKCFNTKRWQSCKSTHAQFRSRNIEKYANYAKNIYANILCKILKSTPCIIYGFKNF